MKKYLFVISLFTSVLFSGLANAQSYYGAKIDPDGAMAMGDLVKQMQGKEEMAAKVEGKIRAVCQTKGCWMTLEKGDGTTMRVTFTDYGFFVPKDIDGKTVIIQGRAKINTTSVDELRHYAEDAKKSKEEIEKITQPKVEMVFEADGVIVK
jgi:hypothetical protein